MKSEYDPLFSGSEPGDNDDLERVRGAFAAAGRPYLRSPWPWLAWAAVLPAAALLNDPVLARFGLRGALLLWSGAILLGGSVEVVGILRGRRRRSTPLAAWVLHLQGNLSLLGAGLSVFLIWRGEAAALPALWLLLLGHFFYTVGALSFPPFRLYGILFQVGGFAALWPGWPPLPIFATVSAVANLWMAWQVRRELRESPRDGDLSRGRSPSHSADR